ncbi:hypothetical protein BN7874_113 [Phage NCTB]|jgi:hypothetical protein|nr:hypothetical protein BN7874_113 [Phage NCTB]
MVPQANLEGAETVIATTPAQKNLVDNIDPERIYTTVGIYLDKSFKSNGVKGEELKGHIEYNLDLRPGRAFFVDGVCFNSGYYETEEDAQAVFNEKCSKIKFSMDTRPYV